MFLYKSKSNYDVIAQINAFLRKLSMVSITRDSKKRIVKVKNRVLFAITIILMILLTVTIVWFFHSFNPFLSNEDFVASFPFLLDCFIIMLMTFHVYGMVILCYTCDVTDSRKFYATYDEVDSILALDNDQYYRHLNKSVNMIFFTCTGVIVLRVAVGLILQYSFMVIRFVEVVLNLEVFLGMQLVSVAHVVIKVYVLHNKFRKFGAKVPEDLHTGAKARGERELDITPQADVLALCYQIIYGQMLMISKEHGWEMLVSCLQGLLMIMRAVCEFASVGFVDKSDVPVVYANISPMSVLCILTIYMTGICEDIIFLRTKILLHLEEVLAFRALNSSEYEAVESLLTQIHRQPLEFSICGLHHLNYRTLQMMFSAAMSYTIVVVQIKST